jgi:hypothetical protein
MEKEFIIKKIARRSKGIPYNLNLELLGKEFIRNNIIIINI